LACRRTFGLRRLYAGASMITWEPYGAVANWCFPLATGSHSYDQSGRLRSLCVSLGTMGTGNLLKKVYTWRGSVPVEEQTCFLSQSNPHRQSLRVGAHRGRKGERRLAAPLAVYRCADT
jgi:hypothetical protein